MEIKDIRNHFPWFKNNSDYIYMDSAATTLKPQSVIDRIVKYYSEEGTNPHNTDSKFTNNIFNKIEAARKNIADFIDASSSDIAFNSGATEGLNLIANGIKHTLKKDDEIILTYGEHASNIIPWIELSNEIGTKIIYAGSKSKQIDNFDILKLINNKTKIVSFASGHNLTGDYFNEQELTHQIKSINPNVIVVVDATQSIQHHKVSIRKSKCDFLVFSGHKIFGPTGIGVIYINPDLQDKIIPFRLGGGMNLSIETKKYESLHNIHKFEGGTQNIAGILGLSTAIDFINEIGYDQIEKYEIELSTYAKKKLGKIKNLIIYNESNKSTTIAFNYEGVFCQDLASYLGTKNIIVRSGLSCAKLYCNVLNTKALVRASLYIYNTKEDIDYLYDVLNNFKKGDELNELI